MKKLAIFVFGIICGLISASLAVLVAGLLGTLCDPEPPIKCPKCDRKMTPRQNPTGSVYEQNDNYIVHFYKYVCEDCARDEK